MLLTLKLTYYRSRELCVNPACEGYFPFIPPLLAHSPFPIYFLHLREPTHDLCARRGAIHDSALMNKDRHVQCCMSSVQIRLTRSAFERVGRGAPDQQLGPHIEHQRAIIHSTGL